MTGLSRLWRISWRNLFRNPRRTTLTLMILVLGSSGLIAVGGFFEDLLLRLREGYIYSQTGHIVVNKKGFYKTGNTDPFFYLLKNSGQLSSEIEKNPQVQFTAPRIYLQGMLSTDLNNLAVLAMGVIPGREKRMMNFKYVDGAPALTLVEGRGLNPQDPYGITVALPLLQSLGLKVGDSVTFITQQKGGAIDGADFHIRGVFQVGIKEVGERLIKIPLSTAQTLLDASDQSHSILVLLDETEKTDQVMKQLEGQLKANDQEFEFLSWYDQGSLYPKTKGFLKRIDRVMEVIIIIIFFLSIANTINMALFERMREYGTMMAIGNNRGTIFQMIVMEATMLGFIGGVIGILFGTFLAIVISQFGIPMPPPPIVGDDVMWMTIRVLVTPMLLLKAFSICFFATLLSSLIPAYRACHFRIIQALSYV